MNELASNDTTGRELATKFLWMDLGGHSPWLAILIIVAALLVVAVLTVFVQRRRQRGRIRRRRGH